MFMGRSGVDAEVASNGLPARDLAAKRLGLFPLLVLSAWCGLVSGLLEVGIILLRKWALDFNQLYWMSRHFIWLIPLINLALFVLLGLASSIVMLWVGQRVRWLAARGLCGLTLLPPVWAAFPRIYGFAGLLLALGIASRLVPALERRSAVLRRLVWVSFPVAALLVPILAAYLLARTSSRRSEPTNGPFRRRVLPIFS